MTGSPCNPQTSLTMDAPAASARDATSDFVVSTDTGTARRDARASTAGAMRRHSSSTVTGVKPGRVDSPPMSRMAAPSPTSSSPRAIGAASWRPPSEKESGVTLRMPITGQDASASRNRLSRRAAAAGVNAGLST